MHVVLRKAVLVWLNDVTLGGMHAYSVWTMVFGAITILAIIKLIRLLYFPTYKFMRATTARAAAECRKFYVQLPANILWRIRTFQRQGLVIGAYSYTTSTEA